MTYYLCVVNDRHTDLGFSLFEDLDDALKHMYAIERLYPYAEREQKPPTGWDYSCTYSGEGDHGYIEKVVLNNKATP